MSQQAADPAAGAILHSARALARRIAAEGPAAGGRTDDAEDGVETAVGACLGLHARDWIVVGRRHLGAALARGLGADTLFADATGAEGSLTGGRDRALGLADATRRILGSGGLPASGVPAAAGLAFGLRALREEAVVLALVAPGGAATGDFHEGVSLAAARRLPLVVVVERRAGAGDSDPVAPASRAVAYGMPSKTVDGSDLAAVRDAVAAARAAALASGPVLIEARLGAAH